MVNINIGCVVPASLPLICLENKGPQVRLSRTGGTNFVYSCRQIQSSDGLRVLENSSEIVVMQVCQLGRQLL